MYLCVYTLPLREIPLAIIAETAATFAGVIVLGIRCCSGYVVPARVTQRGRCDNNNGHEFFVSRASVIMAETQLFW